MLDKISPGLRYDQANDKKFKHVPGKTLKLREMKFYSTDFNTLEHSFSNKCDEDNNVELQYGFPKKGCDHPAAQTGCPYYSGMRAPK